MAARQRRDRARTTWWPMPKPHTGCTWPCLAIHERRRACRRSIATSRARRCRPGSPPKGGRTRLRTCVCCRMRFARRSKLRRNLVTRPSSGRGMLQSRVVITVDNVSMRFGSKVLFEDVTTTFPARPPLRPHRPERRGQVHLHEAADRRAASRRRARSSGPKKLGVLRQDQFAFDRFRVIDTVIMGNARLWSALEERELLYAKAGHDRRGRHAPRRARGHRRRRRRLHGGERRGDPAAGPRHSRRAARAQDGASCRAARRCACCWRRRCSAIRRRCCSTSRPTTSTSTRSTGCAIS